MGLKKMAHSEWDKHSVLRRQMRVAQNARLREDSKMCQDGEFCFFGEPIGEELPQKKQPASQDFYEVTEKIAVLSDNGRTKKEIRRVRWGEHPVMLDIRKWRRENDGSERPRSGISLNAEEETALRKALHL